MLNIVQFEKAGAKNLIQLEFFVQKYRINLLDEGIQVLFQRLLDS